MSGNSRKRTSKWDLKEELESKQLQPPWSSRDGQRDNGSKWSYLEEADKISSENDMEFSSKQNYHGSRGLHKDNITNQDSRRIADSSMAWDRDSSYSARMSPVLENWKHRSRSRSPQNIWHRSVRSRSRSRSRSAERGYRRDMGAHDRSRAGASTQTCRDFIAGNCRRGSRCHFLHDDDKNYDDNRETRYRIDGTSRSVHRGISGGLSQNVADELSRGKEFGRRNVENSFEQVRQEPGRSIDTPCKFFAAGHCRNGKYCRFSHDDQAFASPKGRSKDERRGHNRVDGDVLDRQRQSDTCNPKIGLIDDKRELGHSTIDVNKVWNGPVWDDVGAGSKAAQKEDTNKTMDPPKSGSTSWPVNDRWDHKLEDDAKVIAERTTESGKKESNHWEMQDAGGSINPLDARGVDKWISDVDMSPDWHYRLESSNFVAKEEHVQSKSNLPGDVTYLATHDSDKTEAFPGQGFSENRQLHVVGKNQAIVPDIPSSGNYLEGSHGKLGYVDGQGSIQPNTGKASPLQVNSTIPPTQNTVTSDKLSQLTNLSASLVHLLGKRQQLPQLYATLNSHNSTTSTFGNIEGALGPASPSTIKPDPTAGIQKQHDPICNRIETKNTNASVVPSTSSSNSVGQNDVLAENLERPSLTCISDKVGNAREVGNSDERKADKSEQMIKSQSVKQCETTTENNVAMLDGDKTVQDDNKREKELVASENMERDGDTDEDKKIKDAKVIRAFKFALVEFVKELLKPTWKEGKIAKEDYKTIVKKVIDKVTGSLQANHIPQTQEKIDQYLSFSKAKLNKLVQAYVEKVQKA